MSNHTSQTMHHGDEIEQFNISRHTHTFKEA